jgi:hypothetical protein
MRSSLALSNSPFQPDARERSRSFWAEQFLIGAQYDTHAHTHTHTHTHTCFRVSLLRRQVSVRATREAVARPGRRPLKDWDHHRIRPIMLAQICTCQLAHALLLAQIRTCPSALCICALRALSVQKCTRRNAPECTFTRAQLACR